MASNRHLGRIVALQTLYELDFRVEVEEKNLDKSAILPNLASVQPIYQYQSV